MGRNGRHLHLYSVLSRQNASENISRRSQLHVSKNKHFHLQVGRADVKVYSPNPLRLSVCMTDMMGYDLRFWRGNGPYEMHPAHTQRNHATPAPNIDLNTTFAHSTGSVGHSTSLHSVTMTEISDKDSSLAIPLAL